jgi:hypothetical protein
MMIMNCLTSSGSPNFTKHLTNKYTLLVPKNVLQNLCQYSLKMLTAVKERLQMYFATVYMPEVGLTKCGFLKNSKELQESLKSPNFSQIYSIKTYDFTALYTTIPHDKLKTRLFSIINSSFF